MPGTVREVLNSVWDKVNGKLKVESNLVVKDIQIGAVELKDDVNDIRANVEAVGTGSFVSTLKGVIVKAKAFISNATGTIINPATEEKQDDIITKLENISEKSGYDDHVTYEETITEDTTYTIETDLGKQSEYIIIEVDMDVDLYFDDDIAGSDNAIHAYANAENKIARKCSNVKLDISDPAVDVYMVAFA